MYMQRTYSCALPRSLAVEKGGARMQVGRHVVRGRCVLGFFLPRSTAERACECSEICELARRSVERMLAERDG